MTSETVDRIRLLLDKALADELRMSRQRDSGPQSGPLYLPVVRWDFVREARRLLDTP